MRKYLSVFVPILLTMSLVSCKAFNDIIAPAENTYTIASMYSEGGTVTWAPQKSAYSHGDVVTFTAVPDSGYGFTRWSNDPVGTDNPLSFTINDNVKVGAVFTRLEVPSKPVFSPAAGTYTSGQMVKISSSTTGASIRYTLNGETPSETVGTVYSGAFLVSSSTTVKAVAVKAGQLSALAKAKYVIQLPAIAPAPVSFSPPGGSYGAQQSVTLSTTTSGATIRYTTNGDVPSLTVGTVYNSPIVVSESTTIHAIAINDGLLSTPTSANYTITIDNTETGGGGVSVNQPYEPSMFFSGIDGTLWDGQSLTVRATVQPAPDQYGWFFDGRLVNQFSTPEFTFAKLPVGNHLITLIVNKGPVLASEQVAIHVSSIPAPTISPDGGQYTGGVEVTITSPVPNAQLWYTLNGDTPGAGAGTQYTGPFILTTNSDVKAVTVFGERTSPLTLNSYQIVTGTGSGGVGVNGPYHPTIDSEGLLNTIATGQTMSLSVSVVPAPDSYVWFLDGQKLTEASGATLSLVGGASGAHMVTLVVQKGTQMASKDFAFVVANTGQGSVTVTGPYNPSISLGELGPLVQGTGATVTATVSPSPDTYAWYLDGQSTGETGASANVPSNLPTGSHVLTLVVVKAGVMASENLFFTVVSSLGTISVQGPYDPTFEFSGMPETLATTASATVSVVVNPAPDTYTWYLDGVEQANHQGSVSFEGSALPLGSHVLTLVVAKGSAMASDERSFTVADF